MQHKYLRYLRGYVTITIRGDGIEQFLNLAVSEGVSIWDIHRTGTDKARANVLLRDFFRLRPLLKKTGCRIHVEARFGFPFFLAKLWKRAFFVAGLVGFFIAIFLLSSVIWTVEVEGNDRIPSYQILNEARKQGVKPYQWKFRLQPLEQVARELHKQLPDMSWIGIEQQGTRITIRVVEAAQPEDRELLSPRHLIASKSAVITEIRSTKGKPAVAVNQYVKKGDLLISGIIGNELNQQVVAAEGTVKGMVWYESAVEIPLLRQYQVYSGESFNRYYLVLGTRGIQLSGYRKADYEHSNTEETRRSLSWRNYRLPIGWMKLKVLEVQVQQVTIDEDAAVTAGIQRARDDILLKAGDGASIVSHNVLQQKSENGKVYMNVLFQVEENIAEELVIIQGE